MPLFPPVMSGLIQAKAGLQLMAGSKMSSLVSAISSATCQYLPLVAIVNSTNNVLGPGTGSQFGRISGLSPTLMTTAMTLKAASQGIYGRDLYKFCSAVSFGVVNSLNTVIVQGVVIGGGPGVGIGKVVGLVPSALSMLIMAQEAFRLMGGSKLSNIISSVAFGICTHIMTVGIVNLTDVGVAAPPPVGPIPIPAAPGIGRFY